MIHKLIWISKEKIDNFLISKDINSSQNQVKDKIDSLLDFSDYKDDIESFVYIYKNLNKYNKKNKRLDLTNFVFTVLKPILKDKFIDLVTDIEFTKLILKIYWLDKNKWEYKVIFNSEKWKESFILINISNNRRYSWFTSAEVDRFIFNILLLKDNNEIYKFINKVIYWIDESFEKYTWKNFKQFIYSHILKEVEALLDKNNNVSKMFLEWKKWIIDKKLFIKAMAWKIYRDNFDYIHKIAWHKLMSDIPKVILDEILSNHSTDLKENINFHFNNIIHFLSWFDSDKQSILEIEDEFTNDILINFQDRLKLYFKKFDNTNIDSELLKWTIGYLIENNNLNINIKELSDAIFSLLENNIDDLIKLFWKYNWEVIEEDWKKFIYSKFNIRDFKKIEWKYSVKNIFLWIKSIIDDIKTLEIKLKSLKSRLEKQNITNYSYTANIEIKEKKLLNYEKEIDRLALIKSELEKKIELLKNKSTFDKILTKNNELNKLEVEYDWIYSELLELTRKYKDLEALIFWIKYNVSKLNDWNEKMRREISDLNLILKNKKRLLERVREDFMRNILFWREELK